jgi:hypothetical protein
MTTNPQISNTQDLPAAVKTAAERAGEAIECAARCQQEMLRFANLRLNRYFDMPKDLRACRGPFDVFQCQLEFLFRTQMDYLSESSRMVEEFLGNGSSAPRSEAGRQQDKYGKAILKAQKDAEKIIEMAKAQAARIIADAEARMANGAQHSLLEPEEKRNVA